MTEEDKNTVKVQAISVMISSFFGSIKDNRGYYHLNARYADKADTLIKSIRAIVDGGN